MLHEQTSKNFEGDLIVWPIIKRSKVKEGQHSQVFNMHFVSTTLQLVPSCLGMTSSFFLEKRLCRCGKSFYIAFLGYFFFWATLRPIFFIFVDNSKNKIKIYQKILKNCGKKLTWSNPIFKSYACRKLRQTFFPRLGLADWGTCESCATKNNTIGDNY